MTQGRSVETCNWVAAFPECRQAGVWKAASKREKAPHLPVTGNGPDRSFIRSAPSAFPAAGQWRLPSKACKNCCST